MANTDKIEISYKPTFPQIIMTIVGIACIVFFRNIPGFLLGAFFVAAGLLVQFGLKDYKVFDVYSDHIVVYDDHGNIMIDIDYHDIAEWNINKTKSYSLYIKLIDGRELTRESFQVAKLNKALNRYIADKETQAVRMKRSRETKLVFRNPFKRRKGSKMDVKKEYFALVKASINDVYLEESSDLKKVANIICDTMVNKGVVQLFGSKHANEFVNELNFRAGGLAPYHGMNVSILDEKGLVDHDIIESNAVYDDTKYLDLLLSQYKLDDRDMIIIVSQYGNEPLVVELAKRYHDNGQKVIAVVNMKSYEVALAKHESGKKLLDYADMSLDMGASEPDVALKIGDYRIGQTSSTIANVIAQMLTGEVYNCFIERGLEAPVLLSANIKGADVHNNALTDVYEGRVR